MPPNAVSMERDNFKLSFFKNYAQTLHEKYRGKKKKSLLERRNKFIIVKCVRRKNFWEK